MSKIFASFFFFLRLEFFAGLRKDVSSPHRHYLTHDLGLHSYNSAAIRKKSSFEPVTGNTTPNLTANFSAGGQAPSEETCSGVSVHNLLYRQHSSTLEMMKQK